MTGFDPGRINRSDLAAILPATSTPAMRYPQFYRLNGRDLGLEYQASTPSSARVPHT